MKHYFILVALVVLSVETIHAEDIKIDSLYYQLDSTSNTAMVVQHDSYSNYSSLIIPSSVTYNNVQYAVTCINKAFYRCIKLEDVTIPNTVRWIGNFAFYNSGITHVELPDTLDYLGSAAFEYAFLLKDITWGRYLYRIGADAFQHCHSLDSVSIPDGVQEIGAQAFRYCWNLKSITIPESTTSISFNAFAQCNALSSIYNYAKTPQYDLSTDAFDEVNKSTCILYVPKQSVELYRKAGVWKDFTNIIGMEEESSALPSVTNSAQAGTNKVFCNGQLLILRDGKTYTVQGQEIR